MDVPKEILIDAAINAVGYLAAGICTLVLFSAMSKRKSKPKSHMEEPTIAPTSQVVERPRETGQYVSLSQNTARPTETASSQSHILDNGHRDRQAIMRIAREMLKAGATVDRIRQVLPISTAELALLARAEK